MSIVESMAWFGSRCWCACARSQVRISVYTSTGMKLTGRKVWSASHAGSVFIASSLPVCSADVNPSQSLNGRSVSAMALVDMPFVSFFSLSCPRSAGSKLSRTAGPCPDFGSRFSAVHKISVQKSFTSTCFDVHSDQSFLFCNELEWVN